MTEKELHQLLIEISALDHRTVTPYTVAAWYPILGKFDYALALEAMRNHFGTSTDYLLPAHIAIGCRRILARRGPMPPPGKRWAVDAIEGRPIPIQGGTDAQA